MRAITLKDEQKKVLYLSSDNPVQIKGVAGSGKTTIALHRAKYLIDNNQDLFNSTNVAIFTFNKTLVNYLKEMQKYVSNISSGNDIVDKVMDVKIFNFHKWAYHFIQENGYNISNCTINLKTKLMIIDKIKAKYNNHRFAQKSSEFFVEEISWIKGKMISTFDEYKNVERTNRGTFDRVTLIDRKVIWNILFDYSKELKAMKMIDFDDYAQICFEIIKKKQNFQAPYSHIIIDEAQDLNKAQIMVLSMLVDSKRMSLTIIADSAQKIYKSGFSWKEVGINIVGGRTIELHKNYRNTINIAHAAVSLLEKDRYSEEYSKVYTARKGEQKPILSHFNSEAEQEVYLIDKIKILSNENKLSKTVILHRSNYGVARIKLLLKKNGIRFNELKNSNNGADNIVNICTMSSVKGLEFDHVFIVDLNEKVIPSPTGFDDEQDENHISTERRLLYTSMTRAKESLYMLSNGTPSRFMSEIDEEYVVRL